MKRWSVTLVGLMAGCGAFGAEEPAPTDNVAPATPGSPDGAAPVNDPGASQPAPPPLKGTPADDEITEKFGIFVSPSGVAGAPGTRAKPLADIHEAIERAKVNERRVYVCEGTYKEALTLASGVSVIGGFDCATVTWKVGPAKSRLEAPTSPAVRAADLGKATRLEGFEVLAPAGTVDRPNSIALFAERSPALTIARSKLVGGKAADGAAGTDGVPLSPGGAAAKPGFTGDGPRMLYSKPFREYPPSPLAAAGGTSSCGGGSGGAGDRAGTFTCSEFTTTVGGSTTTWRRWEPSTHLIGSPVNPGTPAETRAGTPGADRASGGSVGSGHFAPEGYRPGDGSAGANGDPGAGGSGGTAPGPGSACSNLGMTWALPSGGGGGAGGCPGIAGTPGKGGGASVGLFLVASEGLTIDHSEILAGAAGAGGKGSFPSSPSLGTAPGAPGGPAVSAAQPGGAGGRGGISGSGAGGPSIGIAHTGGAPKLVETTPKAGTGGAGVAEESRVIFGATATLPASPAGETKDVHPF